MTVLRKFTVRMYLVKHDIEDIIASLPYSKFYSANKTKQPVSRCSISCRACNPSASATYAIIDLVSVQVFGGHSSLSADSDLIL